MSDNSRFYSVGQGEATVYNPAPVVNQFANLLAKQQAQRQLELKQLADQQAQLKPDGLRNDADRKYFFDQVNDWRTKSISAQNERDPYKKALAQSEAQKAYMQAQNTVSQSKQQAAKDNAFQTFAMNNTTRHQLTDDAIQKGLANNKLGVNDPNLLDYSSLQRAPNLEGFNKRLKDLNEARLNNAKEDYKLGAVQSIGNTKQTPVTKYKQVKADDQALDYLNEATVNHDFANVLQSKYPQIYANVQTEDDLHKAHAIASTQLAKETPLYKDYGTSFLKNNAPDRFYEHYNYALKHPKQQGTPSVPGTPQDFTIPFADGKGTLQVKGYIPINSAALNLAGSPSYNLTTGQPEPGVLSSGDHQLVGVANIPFITGHATSGGKSIAGSIAQPDFIKNHPNNVEYRPMLQVQTKDQFGMTEDKLVPYDRLPNNIPKPISAALKGFVPAGSQQHAAPTTSVSTKAAPVAKMPFSNNTHITVQLPDGTTGQIPKGKLKDFQSKYPDAKILK